MLKNIVYFLVLSFLVSACRSKVLIVKRTYSKGYYFSIAKPKGRSNTFIKRNPNSITETVALMGSTAVYKRDPNPCEKRPEQLFVQISKKERQHSKNETDQNQVALMDNIKFNASPVFKPLTKSQPLIVKKETIKKSGKGARKFWLAILCLFPVICLIPVYIHDEKKVTMNFWLTLLLHFTLLGYVIFALLIVFNVVDLR